MNVVGHHFYLTTVCGMYLVIQKCPRVFIVLSVSRAKSNKVIFSKKAEKSLKNWNTLFITSTTWHTFVWE